MKPRSRIGRGREGILLLAVSLATALHAAEVEVRHDFKDDSLRRDVTAVCTDVVGVVESRIGKPPALGAKPFVIRQAADRVPRAVINGLPDVYIVNMTCLDTRFYCQITYQLAHELGHHYVNPYRGNWFIESVAAALSLAALSDMGDRWDERPPFPNWKSWACHFREYREETMQRMLGQLQLKPDEAQVAAWLRTEAPRFLEKGQFDRPQQHACAVIIEAALRRHPKSWGAIPALGGATSESGQTDFEKWEGLVSPEEKPLVRELAAAFKPLMAAPSGK